MRRDPQLGPIFAKAITGDWEPHLRTMMDFWSSVMLKTTRYQGRPMPKHVALKGIADIAPSHFDRWLGLFRATVEATCDPVAAARFIERAELIAESFKLGMFGLPNPNEFPARPAPR